MNPYKRDETGQILASRLYDLEKALMMLNCGMEVQSLRYREYLTTFIKQMDVQLSNFCDNFEVVDKNNVVNIVDILKEQRVKTLIAIQNHIVYVDPRNTEEWQYEDCFEK